MRIQETKFKDVVILTPEVFQDIRGFYIETFNEATFEQLVGRKLHFVQDDLSISQIRVIRGFHGDFRTWKLVQAMTGQFFQVIVDMREESSTFKEYFSIFLTQQNRHQLLIPPGFANGIQATEDNSIYHYKQTTYYVPGKQYTLAWNDPQLNISWPLKPSQISERDRRGMLLSELLPQLSSLQKDLGE